jgi:hypothetical protein
MLIIFWWVSYLYASNSLNILFFSWAICSASLIFCSSWVLRLHYVLFLSSKVLCNTFKSFSCAYNLLEFNLFHCSFSSNFLFNYWFSCTLLILWLFIYIFSLDSLSLSNSKLDKYGLFIYFIGLNLVKLSLLNGELDLTTIDSNLTLLGEEYRGTFVGVFDLK